MINLKISCHLSRLMPFMSDSAIWNSHAFFLPFYWLKFVLKPTGIVATESGLKESLNQILIKKFRNYGKTERHN